MQSRLSAESFSALSERELQVLEVIARDKTDREVARHLGIRERTVRAHVGRIIVKLGVASRVGAAVAFVRWNAGERGCDCSRVAEKPMVALVGGTPH
ncbi:regulatory LuxR family protein [Saccharothrix carnea]|uniref:Regulatory LuxR family protein n=1 Tax=Saccharothrix carnea TaxID=1280637 RepID=A0A2P8HBT1_SACCR|nr:helix-turn-helix transcriptional regulator [Saccharothrix carnea]PSL43685.1 regulatory LuxR family protein [Saccharothrix carnea]